MKNDVILYEKIYKHLKNKIESGLLPEGYQLPSRANMCKEYETSEKPVRCAIKMLEQDGLIKIEPRKRPTVVYRQNSSHKIAELSHQRAASTDADDALKSGVLLCYPVIKHGISLCREEDWVIPERIVKNMDAGETTKFWHLSNSFWRFFVARNGNELILRTVDSMGYSEQVELIGNYEVRYTYLLKLREFLHVLREGKDPASVPFEDMSSVYSIHREVSHLEEKLRRGQERYSTVCLDILGLINMGWYEPGDYLPSHKEMQKIYGISIDTTLRAIKTLKDWGVVKTAPNKGIWVTMDLEEIKKVQISPEQIACHVRRLLDSLELLELTIEGVTLHAMEDVDEEEAKKFYNTLENQWNDSLKFHFFPSALLEFITGHIQYDTLRTIYVMLRKNFRIGRSIPRLIGREKTDEDHANHEKCLLAVSYLIDGDTGHFAELIGRLFHDIRQQIIAACRRKGYWDDAMNVYDGKSLWQ